MTPIKILLAATFVLGLASCSSTTEQTEQAENNSPNDSMATSEIKQIDTGIRAVDYIPPIGTGQSSAGNVKRERKFYIR